MRRMDRDLVEHLDEPAMNRSLYGFCASFESNIYVANLAHHYLPLLPKEIRTNLWLSSTSDAEKSLRLYVGFLWSELRQRLYTLYTTITHKKAEKQTHKYYIII